MLPTLYEEKETSEEDERRPDRTRSVSNFLAFSASWGRFYGQSSPLMRVRVCLLRRNLEVLGSCHKSLLSCRLLGLFLQEGSLQVPTRTTRRQRRSNPSNSRHHMEWCSYLHILQPLVYVHFWAPSMHKSLLRACLVFCPIMNS